MQVVSQDGSKAVIYKGVSIGANNRGMTVISVLTEGGESFAMGYFTDRNRAKKIAAEIILSVAAAEKEVYYIPAE